MNSKKQRRRRGVILTPQGLQKLKAAESQAELRENKGKRYTLEALSDRTGLNPDTLIKVFACQVGVDKQTLNCCFKAFNLRLEPSDYSRPDPEVEKREGAGGEVRRDWSEAPDVSVFYGRTEELATLHRWIVGERCRLVALSGMGGTGKTCLLVRTAEQIEDGFELAIWQSLRHAPPVSDILAELLRFLSNECPPNPPKAWGGEGRETAEAMISQLIRYLREHRCLLVLDDVEAILGGGAAEKGWRSSGNYRSGCEGYGELFRRLGESAHQSCLLLASREKPKEIRLLEGETLPVRSLKLTGLPAAEAEKILRGNGCFWESPAESRQLIDFYAGSPLALKIVSQTVFRLFEGSISEFVKHNINVFGDICSLLEQHFARLSEAEKEIIKWLAINREPATFSEMLLKMLPAISPQKLLEDLESLEERSLIEKKAGLFSLQPVVVEYVTDQLISDRKAVGERLQPVAA
ncbi:MAG: ATP-binding protein [Oscillatoria sp. Prado101]|jgi:DNA-binding HxlR family transcriptional regulator|nr:ATP-binding protein [Oscillatoria sp. Prado101]